MKLKTTFCEKMETKNMDFYFFRTKESVYRKQYGYIKKFVRTKTTTICSSQQTVRKKCVYPFINKIVEKKLTESTQQGTI